MIVFTANRSLPFDASTLSELEQSIYKQKLISSIEYLYDDADDLLFELRFRRHLLETSLALSKSGVHFAGFSDSKCNDMYWDRTPKGRFRLKKGESARKAINDIFVHGHLYAFECSTAVVVVLYQALLKSIGPRHFDRLFPDLLVFDWEYNRYLHLIERSYIEEAVIGDVLYFDNPDFSSSTPWWRGQNVVKLDHNLYYGHGHGVGIVTANEVITVLNRFRKPYYSKSALLTPPIVHPDFHYFSKFQSTLQDPALIAIIGSMTYAGG